MPLHASPAGRLGILLLKYGDSSRMDGLGQRHVGGGKMCACARVLEMPAVDTPPLHPK